MPELLELGVLSRGLCPDSPALVTLQLDILVGKVIPYGIFKLVFASETSTKDYV